MTHRCRACGASTLATFLPLGTTPLANALLTKAQLSEPEPRFPLDVAFCSACTLVQILETVPPEKMFSEYLYFSSNSTTMVEHAARLAERLVDSRRLGTNSLVIEAASNDGYLLKAYRDRAVPVLGIEPARNIAAEAVAKGIDTLCAFFGSETAAQLAREGRFADVIHANNVLAHVPDLPGFIRAFKTLLKSDGVVVVEAPYVKDLIEHLEFDTVYHEHLCYFSLTALDQLFRSQGLVIIDVERMPIHGGSLRIFAAHTGEPSGAVRDLLALEQSAGVTRSAYYNGFAAEVEALGVELRRVLARLKSENKRIAAYGASAKGSTLLNTFAIGLDTLDFVVDRSTHKQGRFMPGVHVPIGPPEWLIEKRPDYVLLLTWNFADEILAQQREFRARGGKFIIPLPSPTVV